MRRALLLKIQSPADSPTIITSTTRCWEVAHGLEIYSMFWANGQKRRREGERKLVTCCGQMGRERGEKVRGNRQFILGKRAEKVEERSKEKLVMVVIQRL